MSQLPLPIVWPRDRDEGHLLVHAGNADALALLRAPGAWPSHAQLLVGPRKSGRSLAARLFARETGGIIVDDADARSEEWLFNLWNETRDEGEKLLLVALDAPPAWAIDLPDLRTRLATAGVARILPPDEAVTAQLIAHGLERLGSAFAPDMPDYVARRIERCYHVIDTVVGYLDAESLASGRKLGIALARETLVAAGLMVAG